MTFHAAGSFSMLLTFLLAGVVLCLLAAAGDWTLRRRSAAMRSWLWQVVAISILATSVITLLPVGYPVTIAYRSANVDRAGGPAALAQDKDPPPLTRRLGGHATTTDQSLVSQADTAASGAATGESPTRIAKNSLPGNATQHSDTTALPLELGWIKSAAVWAWLVVFLVICVRLIHALVAAGRLVRRASANHSLALDATLRQRCRQAGIAFSSPPTVMLSADVVTPAVIGIVRPTIMLPTGATRWSPQRVKMVLEHECSHIVRRDTLWHTIFRLACGAAWPNPLIWWAMYRYVTEREQACDDMVLRRGYSPVDYGQTLVEIAKGISRKLPSLAPSVSMARPPIQARLRSILHRDTDRTPSTPWQRALLTSCWLTLAVVLGGLRPFPGERVHGQENTIAEGRESRTLERDDQDSPSGVRFLIRDQDGSPVQGAKIDVFQWTGGYKPTGASRQTDASGRAEFAALPPGERLYARVMAEGHVTAMPGLQLNQPSERDMTLVLSRPAKARLDVVDPGGKPIEGAEIQFLQYIDHNGSQMYIDAKLAPSQAIQLEKSDRAGRLPLPPLPPGVQLSASVIHPLWASARTEVEVVDGLTSTVTLHPGVLVEVDLQVAGSANTVLDQVHVDVLLYPHRGSARDSGSVRHRFGVSDGKLRFTAGKENYSELRVSMEDYFVGPSMVNFPDAPRKELDLRAATSSKITLTAFPKVAVRGRVIDYHGQAMRDVYVAGILEADDSAGNLASPTGESAKAAWMKLVNSSTAAGSTSTDQDGYYQIELSPGRAMVEVIHQGYYSMPDTTPVVVDSTGSVVIPDITLVPVPVLKGIVRTENDQSAGDVIVRMRSRGRGDADPIVLTDAAGAFELKMSRIPYAADGDGLETTVHVVAMDPKRNVGGSVEVDLTDPAQTSGIQIKLASQAPEWFFNPFGDNASEPGQSESQQQFLAWMRKNLADGMPGEPVPPMSQGTWLNTDAQSLADFRGRFVLLDFWFIGCGPCHRDMPQIKVAHDAFPKDQFAVVSVHNNSASADRVKAFVEKNDMEYAVVVDDHAGSILKQYRLLGVSGFPSYILLDPDGNIAHNDRVSLGRSLRLEKLEIIHQALQSWNWDE